MNTISKKYMPKVAGVTILYNPEKDVYSNIKSYVNQVEKLYIVDNSNIQVKEVIDNLRLHPEVEFIDNKDNIGIAAALNKSARKAIEDGFELLLTMDQDSRISDNLVYEMLNEFEKDEKIGVLSPFVVHMENPRKPLTNGLEKITVAMTSGCIIKLSAYKEIGEFLEKFFIDYVDNEFCLRMQLAGYKVLLLNSVFVYHRLGAAKPRFFLSSYVFPTNHPSLRWYYMTRNRLYVYDKYKEQFPDYVRFDKKVFLKFFIKILLYENEKLKKIKMMIKGYIDFRKNRYGQYKN